MLIVILVIVKFFLIKISTPEQFGLLQYYPVSSTLSLQTLFFLKITLSANRNYYIFSKKAVFLAKMVVHFSEKNRIYAKVILAGLFILQLMILLVCNKKARNCSYLTTISDFLMLVIFEQRQILLIAYLLDDHK